MPRRVAAEDKTISALIDGIIVGMWRTGSYTQLDPGAIPDTPPAVPDVSTPALYPPRQQGRKISWQLASPKTPGTGTLAKYEAYKI